MILSFPTVDSAESVSPGHPDRLAATIAGTPGTYDQDGLGDQAMAFLHYFTPSADFWILEKHTGAATDKPEQ